MEVLTLKEYFLLMRAYRLRKVDQEYDMHLNAWLHRAAGATKMIGQKEVSAYKKFKDFFDYEARLKEVEGPKKKKISNQNKRLAHLAAKANRSE